MRMIQTVSLMIMSDANNKAKKTREQVLKENAFKPGQVANPKGRPKGSRNKFSEAFIKDFMNEWDVGGAEALMKVRQDDPSTFLRIAASILPKEFNVNEGESSLERLLEQYEDRELNELITGIRALGNAGESGEGKEEKKASVRPSSVH